MKYFLIANNKNLLTFNYSYIFLSFLNPEDIIVTFNHCLPLDIILKKINHKKIHHYSRRNIFTKFPYSGLHMLDKNKDLFEKIYLWPHPDSLGNPEEKTMVQEYIKEHTSLQSHEIHHMPGFGSHPSTRNMKNFLADRYNGVTHLSMGLIAYLHLHQHKKPEDQIFLIGFTHDMDLNLHNGPAEKDFFAIEKEKGLCRMIPLIL